MAGAFLSVRGRGHNLTPYASHVMRLRRLVDVETGDLADSSGDHHQENVLALFRFGLKKRSCLAPSCLRRGTGGDRDPRR